jgi:hypothetical protein
MQAKTDLYARAFLDLFETHWPRFWRSERRSGNQNQEDAFGKFLAGNCDMKFGSHRIQSEFALPGQRASLAEGSITY